MTTRRAYLDYNSAPAISHAEFLHPCELRGLDDELVQPPDLYIHILASANLVWQEAQPNLHADERDALVAGDLLTLGGYQDPRMRFTYQLNRKTRAIHAYCAVVSPSDDHSAGSPTHIKYLHLGIVSQLGSPTSVLTNNN